MSKKVTNFQKDEIKKLFLDGSSIKDISVIFNFSIQTITRQLKIIFGENKFKNIKKMQNLDKLSKPRENDKSLKETKTDQKENSFNKPINNDQNTESISLNQEFFEIKPLTDGVEFQKQRDISSEPIENVELPKVLYMVIDQKLELDPKPLRDYPDWSFLPEEDLNRNTLEVFSDQSLAKRSCSKNQKMIKIPNPHVFILASPKLKSKGISRIVFGDLLLSL